MKVCSVATKSLVPKFFLFPSFLFSFLFLTYFFYPFFLLGFLLFYFLHSIMLSHLRSLLFFFPVYFLFTSLSLALPSFLPSSTPIYIGCSASQNGRSKRQSACSQWCGGLQHCRFLPGAHRCEPCRCVCQRSRYCVLSSGVWLQHARVCCSISGGGAWSCLSLLCLLILFFFRFVFFFSAETSIKHVISRHVYEDPSGGPCLKNEQVVPPCLTHGFVSLKTSVILLSCHWNPRIGCTQVETVYLAF